MPCRAQLCVLSSPLYPLQAKWNEAVGCRRSTESMGGRLALSRGRAIALLEIPALTHNDSEVC